MSEDLLPPMKRIGQYELLAPLGAGGMAQVYRAQMAGPGLASKQVALKLVDPALAQDKKFVLMFLDEVRLAMALTHRNIVQTFDGGEVDEHYFLVMELVEGLSLSDLLWNAGKRAIPMEVALFIAIEVCAALDYAHHFQFREEGPAEGVLHRDVSPSNILLSRQGDVKLVDFGIAKAAGRLALTRASEIKGKLTYMPPEQARGRPVQQSDIYALGAVLYKMLAQRSIRTSPSLEDVRIGRLDLLPLHSVRPDIPLSLEQTVLSCLAVEPGDRPATAGALREALADVAFRLQSQRGQRSDPHSQLSVFLSQCMGEADPSVISCGVEKSVSAELDLVETIPLDESLMRTTTQLKPGRLAVQAPAASDSTTVTEHTEDGVKPSEQAADVESKATSEITVQQMVAPQPAGSRAASTLMTQPALKAPSPRHVPEPVPEAPGPGGAFDGPPARKNTRVLDRSAAQNVASMPDLAPMPGGQSRKHRQQQMILIVMAGVLLTSAFLLFWLMSSTPEEFSKPVALIPTAPPLVEAGGTMVARDGRGPAGPRAAGPRDFREQDHAAAVQVTSIVTTRDSGGDVPLESGDAGGHRPPPAVNSPPAANKITRPASKKQPDPSITRWNRRGAGSGRLNLNTIPWARVKVDGRSYGSTPLQGVNLSAGWHNLKIFFPTRNKSVARRILIRAMKPTTLVLDLDNPR